MEGGRASHRHSVGLFGEDRSVGISRNEPLLYVGNIIVCTVAALRLLAVVTAHRINYNRQFDIFYYHSQI
jgi:hypothetical protein